MALRIEDNETEILAAAIGRITGETPAQAVRQALLERQARLKSEVESRERYERLERFLRETVWPNVPPEILGRGIPKEEQENILGFGPEGY